MLLASPAACLGLGSVLDCSLVQAATGDVLPSYNPSQLVSVTGSAVCPQPDQVLREHCLTSFTYRLCQPGVLLVASTSSSPEVYIFT